jgi:hypothetical protein
MVNIKEESERVSEREMVILELCVASVTNINFTENVKLL